MASQQEKAFCVLRFEVCRSEITVQREFRARFHKDTPQQILSCVFIWAFDFNFGCRPTTTNASDMGNSEISVRPKILLGDRYSEHNDFK
jgi:hypothetical protein